MSWVIVKEILKMLVEVFILWVVLYQVYRAFRATRGARILLGLLVSLFVLWVMAALMDMTVISWLLDKLLPVLGISMVVIFQPELRTALAKLGSHPVWSSFPKWLPMDKLQREGFLDDFCRAASKLSNQRCGALFAFERGISMKSIEDTGVQIDSLFSPELAMSIFHTGTALHDGGMVIDGDRISAAGCVFPVTQKQMSDRTLGLRHRAAVGISEESDCVVVVVSEETGSIAIALAGKLERNLTPEQLKGRLEELLNLSTDKENAVISK